MPNGHVRYCNGAARYDKDTRGRGARVYPRLDDRVPGAVAGDSKAGVDDQLGSQRQCVDAGWDLDGVARVAGAYGLSEGAVGGFAQAVCGVSRLGHSEGLWAGKCCRLVGADVADGDAIPVAVQGPGHAPLVRGRGGGVVAGVDGRATWKQGVGLGRSAVGCQRAQERINIHQVPGDGGARCNQSCLR